MVFYNKVRRALHSVEFHTYEYLPGFNRSHSKYGPDQTQLSLSFLFMASRTSLSRFDTYFLCFVCSAPGS